MFLFFHAHNPSLVLIEHLKGSDVLVGCVIGFSHGKSSTPVKVFETEQACLRSKAIVKVIFETDESSRGNPVRRYRNCGNA